MGDWMNTEWRIITAAGSGGATTPSRSELDDAVGRFQAAMVQTAAAQLAAAMVSDSFLTGETPTR